jgi:tRNA(Ile2) C34 agmatinyltransferase TiaS
MDQSSEPVRVIRCPKCRHWMASQCKNGRRCPYCNLNLSLKDREVVRKLVKTIDDAAIAVKELNRRQNG